MTSDQNHLDGYRAIVQQLISDIEARVVDQVNRRVLTELTADHQNIVDNELEYAKISLEELAEDFDAEGERVGAELVRSLIDDWLPLLAGEIKSQI